MKQPNIEIRQSYKQYWDMRDSKVKKAKKLQQMATDTTVNSVKMAWGSIQVQTEIVKITFYFAYFLQDGCQSRLNFRVKILGDISTSNISSNKNTNDNEDYFHDDNETVEDSLDDIIDWTLPAAREMAVNKLLPSTLAALRELLTVNEYEYSVECQSLVHRLTNKEKSVMGWRNELLKDHEFTNRHFDPIKHQDWSYVKFITEHFIRFMEFSPSPLNSQLAERTAISYTIQPIFNHLLLPYTHLLKMKWIEVNNDYTENTKIDGLGTLQGSREILLIIEFAGRNVSSSSAKYENDIKKIYENALKAIRQSRREKIFTVLYFDNSIYYEVLLKFKIQYARYNYTISRCPVNPPEL